MSNITKVQIEEFLNAMKENNTKLTDNLTDKVLLTEYSHLVRKGEKGIEIWTDAFQTALNNHQIIIIPDSDTPYYIDKTVTIPSNRRIEAENGAVIRQLEGVKVLMLRNEHTKNGTNLPIKSGEEDENITIIGGRWEESYRQRLGYGSSGMYDEERSFYGVSTCFLFNNLKNLTLKNLTFAHTAGFSIQIGDIENVVAENIEFSSCYADGLHINGNTTNVLVRNLSGQVGDDLLALNMYDWQNSSVNFGPLKMLLAENIIAANDGSYKTLRILPGVYNYDDGSSVDCSLNNAILRNIKGVLTYKMYYQTFPYEIAKKNVEKGGVGSCDNVFFEDINVDLSSPADLLTPYLESDPVRGDMAAFEIGSNIGTLTLENINVTLHRDIYPLSHFISIGPKSVKEGNLEIFDPYVSSTLKKLVLSNITINGEKITDFTNYIKEITFDDLYGDGFSSGKGEIKEIIVKN